MKGCSRPPTMMMPLIAPTIRPTQGATSSTPSTPNLVATCGSRNQSAERRAGEPDGDRQHDRRAAGRARASAAPAGRGARSAALRKTKRVSGGEHDEGGQRQRRDAHRGRRRPARHGQQHGADDRADRHDRADREVDAGGQDHRRHAGGDQAGDRDLPQHVEQVAVGEEDVVALGADRRGQHADQEDRRQAPVELGAREEPQQRSRRQRRACGAARRGELHDRLLARLGARRASPVCRPSDITRMRSASSSSSGSSELTMTIASPSPASAKIRS